MRGKHITIKEVAGEAGVSITTVSRVLNGQPGQMAEGTRERVLSAIDRLNYIPNRLASGLKQDRSHTLGVVVSNIMNPFFTALARGVQDYATSKGYEAFICNTDDNPELEADFNRGLLSRRVDGLIVTRCNEDLSLYTRLATAHFPLVFVDRSVEGISADTVVINNTGISEHVFEHLIRLGHRYIGIISPPLGNVVPRIERINGCRTAALKKGLDLDKRYTIQVDFRSGAPEEPIHDLLSLQPRPTALFVLNTFLACEALKEIRRMDIKVPNDLSFVMFDDPDWSELFQPPISAIRQPSYEIGKIAARLAIDRIHRRNKPHEKILLNAEFIERGSIATPQKLLP